MTQRVYPDSYIRRVAEECEDVSCDDVLRFYTAERTAKALRILAREVILLGDTLTAERNEYLKELIEN